MNLINKTEASQEVLVFIRESLAPFDLSKLEYFKLLPLTKNARYHGRCTYPKRAGKGKRTFLHQYQIRCSVHEGGYYPYEEDVRIGTETDKEKDLWWYVHKEEVFLDREELLVYLAGHEAFHFLRHSKQMPGRNTEPQANVYGLKWLEDYRKQKKGGRNAETSKSES